MSAYFINAENGWFEARKLAEQTLKHLNVSHVPFYQAVSYGDRFLYHTNYVDKEADLIASHFGEPMQRQVFAAAKNSVDTGIWIGPFQSPYGYHLTLITNSSDAYIPDLDTVRGRVYQDVQQITRETALNDAIAAIVDGYEIEIDVTLTKTNSPEHPKTQVLPTASQ